MELRHLRYFVAIAEERSFTRAAERLWVAQPGLSTQIRRLEAEIGVQLFVRRTRGVDLTDAGALFFERARAVLAAADVARATGEDLASGVVGSLRLGMPSEAGWSRASELLESFSASRPGVELTVHQSHAGTIVRDLRDGRLDAVIAPSTYRSPELQSVKLGEDAWVVLVGSTHRLAGFGPLAAGELQRETILVTGHRDGAGYDRAVAEVLRDAGVKAALQRGGPAPALLAWVVRGKGLALTTAAELLTSELMARPLAPVQTLHFDLLWRAEVPSGALSELIDTAQRMSVHWRPRHVPARVAVA